jgi:hypothetical protein
MISTDTRDIDKLATKLAFLHKKSLPLTVKGTLNSLAIDVKKNTLLPSILSSGMTIRSKSFFKAYSGVKKVNYSEWDVSKMFSQVGMIPDGKAAGKADKTVEALKIEDEGGTISNNKMIPLYASRKGRSHKKLLQNEAYWKNLKNNIVGKVAYGDKKELIRLVTKTGIKSSGNNKEIGTKGIIYGKFLYGIQGFERIKPNKIKLHLTRLYEVRANKSIHISGYHFMPKAAKESEPKASYFFAKEAAFQISKIK